MGTNVDAIVLGLGINGLAVVRSLGEKGLIVGGLYNNVSEEPGVFSKYLSNKKYFNKENSALDLFRVCTDLIGETRDKVVIICTTDLFSELVAANSDIYNDRFILTTPDKNLYWKFLKKQPTAKICMDNKLQIPETIFVEEGGDLLDKCKNLSFPAIIKPDITYEETFPSKVIVANTMDEIKQFLMDYPKLESKVVIQEIIPSGDGKLFIVSTYSDCTGTVRAIYTGKKVRSYLPDFGVTSYGISCSCEDLKLTATNFLNKIKYSGFADLEFAYDEVKNEYFFIELNIRTSYLNQLYKDSGVDLNYVGYLASKGLPYDHLSIKQKDDVRWCDFTRDLGSCYWKIKEGKVKFVDCVVDIFRARSFAYFNINDLRPFMVSIKYFLVSKMKRLAGA